MRTKGAPGRPPPVLAAALLALAAGCGSSEVARPVEATSLLGRPLRRPDFPDERRQQLEADLAEARARLAAAPEDEDALIWVGRRLAYLGRYRDAAAAFTRGLEIHPQSHRLLRHRGHRMITLRRFDEAVRDLSRAAELAADLPDAVEPDGAPNRHGIPRSTTKSNIWYHLALAHYLRRDLAAALPAWRQCLVLARVNDDMFVAAANWLCATLFRLGRDAEARDVLGEIRRDMEILENEAYHRLLLLYKGELDAGAVLSRAAGEESLAGVTSATAAYGVANRHLWNGRRGRALQMFQEIVASSAWPAFGHIAAEAELAALRHP